MAEYTVLDLFCGRGGFSSAFRDSDEWDVVIVDIDERFDPTICADVFDLRPSEFTRDFDVVLASPPCTQFSMANQPNPHWDGDTPTSDDIRDAIALVYHTLGIIRGLNPAYWFLENPRQGKLSTVLGKPTGYVTYCQYGLEWQKPTDLWGDHPQMQYLTCQQGAACHQRAEGGWDTGEKRKHVRDPAERSLVPDDLSNAIRNACEAGICGEVAEQVTLDAV